MCFLYLLQSSAVEGNPFRHQTRLGRWMGFSGNHLPIFILLRGDKLALSSFFNTRFAHVFCNLVPYKLCMKIFSLNIILRRKHFCIHIVSFRGIRRFFLCKLSILEEFSKISVLKVLETSLPSTFHTVPSQPRSHSTLLSHLGNASFGKIPLEHLPCFLTEYLQFNF